MTVDPDIAWLTGRLLSSQRSASDLIRLIEKHEQQQRYYSEEGQAMAQNQKGEFEKHLEKLEKWLGESQAALDQSLAPADWFQQHAYPPNRDGWKRVHQHITDALEHIKAAQTEVMNELQQQSRTSEPEDD